VFDDNEPVFIKKMMYLLNMNRIF